VASDLPASPVEASLPVSP